MGVISGDEASRTGGQSPSGEASPGGEYSSEELDQVFHILRNRRRRDVLRYLSDAPKQVTLGELAEHIAARECEKPVGQLRSQERKRVYVALYQCHLPRMAGSDAVRFERDRGTIESGPDFAQFVRYLPDTEEPPVGGSQSETK